MKTILTATLEIAYEESGPSDGPPVILMHGFPDDVLAYFCRKLWELWSSNYRFEDAEYERKPIPSTTPILSKWRSIPTGTATGRRREIQHSTTSKPSLRRPVITVPTIVLHGESDGVSQPQSSERHDRFFIGPYQRRVEPGAGHFLPCEIPEAVVKAVRHLWLRYRGHPLLAIPAYIWITDLARDAAAPQFGGWC
jgi:pimeloyl-ACP methyl ester carboxylesterase